MRRLSFPFSATLASSFLLLSKNTSLCSTQLNSFSSTPAYRNSNSAGCCERGKEGCKCCSFPSADMIPYYGGGKKIAFLACDLQSVFANLVPNFSDCVNVAKRFAIAAGAEGAEKAIPNTKFIATEQYPEKLGKTVPEIPFPTTTGEQGNFKVYSKFEFSMVKSISKDLADCQTVVVFGIEAHVCVLQTVQQLMVPENNVPTASDKSEIDLKNIFNDKLIVLAVDGVHSTNGYDEAAVMRYFDALASASAGKYYGGGNNDKGSSPSSPSLLLPNRFAIMSSESILFQLVRNAKDPYFKNVSNIVKNIPIRKKI